MLRGERWVGVAVVSICLLVIIGATTWYRWLPDFRPRLDAGQRYGVDVSGHQGRLDWSAVADDDIAFAYIKATEGGDLVDHRFAENWTAAGAAGLDRGAYHFFTLCRDGAQQAANFLDAVPSGAELPPAIDLELAGNCGARPQRELVLASIGDFIDALEVENENTVVLYIGDDFEHHYHVRDDLQGPVWYRRLLLHPGFEDWWIWQAHDRAHVEGIGGPADLDVMQSDRPTAGT